MSKELLSNQVKELLSEESLQLIESAVNDKIKLAVDVALTEQDELYSKKLEQLLEAVDKDHANKFKRVMESIDRSNALKLKKVIKKYTSEINEGAESFKTTLVETVSRYLDEYIDEAIPQGAILEATRNKSAISVLKNLRKVLAVDSAIMKESVKDALKDGKTQLDTLRDELANTRKELQVIKESNEKLKSTLVLEQKSAKLPQTTRDYVTKVLKDKSAKFIVENFDYTVKLFERQEKEQIRNLKEQAFEGRTVKADAPVITESKQKKEETPANAPLINTYLQELQRI